MASFNKVILMGNMVADPELRTTPNGISVSSFRIAVGRKFVKAGEAAQTDFVDIVAWRQQAEFVVKYFRKGAPILVCGSLQTRTWDDKDGNKRYTTEVIADEISFTERRSVSEGSGAAPAFDRPSPYISAPESSPKFEELSNDDDLPF